MNALTVFLSSQSPSGTPDEFDNLFRAACAEQMAVANQSGDDEVITSVTHMRIVSKAIVYWVQTQIDRFLQPNCVPSLASRFDDPDGWLAYFSQHDDARPLVNWMQLLTNVIYAFDNLLMWQMAADDLLQKCWMDLFVGSAQLIDDSPLDSIQRERVSSYLNSLLDRVTPLNAVHCLARLTKVKSSPMWLRSRALSCFSIVLTSKPYGLESVAHYAAEATNRDYGMACSLLMASKSGPNASAATHVRLLAAQVRTLSLDAPLDVLKVIEFFVRRAHRKYGDVVVAALWKPLLSDIDLWKSTALDDYNKTVSLSVSLKQLRQMVRLLVLFACDDLTVCKPLESVMCSVFPSLCALALVFCDLQNKNEDNTVQQEIRDGLRVILERMAVSASSTVKKLFLTLVYPSTQDLDVPRVICVPSAEAELAVYQLMLQKPSNERAVNLSCDETADASLLLLQLANNDALIAFIFTHGLEILMQLVASSSAEQGELRRIPAVHVDLDHCVEVVVRVAHAHAGPIMQYSSTIVLQALDSLLAVPDVDTDIVMTVCSLLEVLLQEASDSSLSRPCVESLHLHLSLVADRQGGMAKLCAKDCMSVLSALIQNLPDSSSDDSLSGPSDTIREKKESIKWTDTDGEEIGWSSLMADLQHDAPPIRAYALHILRHRICSMHHALPAEERAQLFDIFLAQMDHEDSYVFLSAITGLSFLADVAPDSVIPQLCTLFQQTSVEEPTEDAIKHRLKLGEVLVKVAMRCGALLPRYAHLFLSSYLLAVRDSNVDIRVSALSNLGTLVAVCGFSAHPFVASSVYTLLDALQVERSMEPIRRAAAFALDELLMALASQHALVTVVDKPLFDAIFSRLVAAAESDSDEAVRMHVQNALSVLADNYDEQVLRKWCEEEIQTLRRKGLIHLDSRELLPASLLQRLKLDDDM